MNRGPHVSRLVTRIAASAALVLLVVPSACRRGEPPAADVDAAVAPLPPPGPASSGGRAADVHGGEELAHAPAVARGPETDAGTSGATTATAAVEVADAGSPALPQTRDKPKASGAGFDARVQALWEGIQNDDPERAMPFFFPLPAYEQVKAASNPAADWRRRLVAAYKRDLHALHERLGDHAKDARFVRIDVHDDRAKWVEPGEEYNKLGYWRVYGTRLVYEVNGKERTFEVTSLISWRGEWYVVHLSGFK